MTRKKPPTPTTEQALAMAAESIAADMADLRAALARPTNHGAMALGHMISARDSLWLLERLTVMHARENGATWAQLGEAYGTSRQAVQQRLSDTSEPISSWPTT